uniref:Alpha-1,2-fucosyltransferase n=1 Tax=viral metagenome TaxID=1070528 RepID=A0A6C0HLW5_9ZZZZ
MLKNKLTLKITPILTGGLGNQLFKIGCALNYAKKLNRTLYISKSHFIKNNHQSSEKTFDTLSKLFPWLEIGTDSIDYHNTYTYSEQSDHAFKFNDITKCIPESIIANNNNILLDGYFINPQYLDCYFCDAFTIKPNNDMSRYGTFANCYFIHIRLDDYVNNALYKIELAAYYTYCIKAIKTADNNAKFIICTNERGINLDNYIKQFPGWDGNCNDDSNSNNSNNSNSDKTKYEYIIQDINDDELDTLYIMSSCAGGICSNSTLSWMGSYLQKPNALRFMPYPWINFIYGFNHDNTIGIYPEWVCVYNTINNFEIKNL